MSKRMTNLNPSMAVSLVALVISLGGASIAATGGNFILGQSNTADARTTLTSNVAGAQALRIVNTDAGPNSSALALTTASTRPPFVLNSRVRVANLNADLLDGLDAAAFARTGNIDAQTLDGLDSAAFALAGNVDAQTFDGLDSTAFARVGFVDAQTLNGLDSSAFPRVGSVDAQTLDSLDSTDFALAGNVDAQTLDGFDSTAFARVGNVDAQTLDGFDSAAFVLGGGVADGQAVATAPNTLAFLGPATGGFIRLRYTCPFGLGGNGILRIINASSSLANLFIDSGNANPDYLQLFAGGFVDYPAAAGGESFSIQAQGAPGVETIEVATVHRSSSNDCHAQAFLQLAP